MRSWHVALLGAACSLLSIADGNAQIATLDSVNADHCDYSRPRQCANRDAVVFVHGIYGSDDTFTNSSTHFDWTKSFPRFMGDREIDVFKLNYHTKLLAWARGANPEFTELALSVLSAMKPLRTAEYRSIGFIAHSLGGNVISTYVHSVKTQLGHP